jgi:hypothetical protein
VAVDNPARARMKTGCDTLILGINKCKTRSGRERKESLMVEEKKRRRPL